MITRPIEENIALLIEKTFNLVKAILETLRLKKLLRTLIIK